MAVHNDSAHVYVQYCHESIVQALMMLNSSKTNNLTKAVRAPRLPSLQVIPCEFAGM